VKRALPLLFVLLLAPASGRAQEEADPLSTLPRSLRPGVRGVFTQEAVEGRLKGTLAYRVEKGAEKDTVRILTEFATADLGPLTFRYRLNAVLEAKSRKFTSFTYEIAGSDPNAFRLRSRFGPDPQRPGKVLHERFDVRENGETRVKKTRPKLRGVFVPDLLEPFCTALGVLFANGVRNLQIFTVERGRVLKTPVGLLGLGNGKMQISGTEVPCRILRRTKGDRRTTVYLRKSDDLPLRYGATQLKEAP
jgi:hypothetical protein